MSERVADLLAGGPREFLEAVDDVCMDVPTLQKAAEEYNAQRLPGDTARTRVIVHEDTSEVYTVKSHPCPNCPGTVRCQLLNRKQRMMVCNNEKCEHFIIGDIHVYNIDKEKEKIMSKHIDERPLTNEEFYAKMGCHFLVRLTVSSANSPVASSSGMPAEPVDSSSVSLATSSSSVEEQPPAPPAASSSINDPGRLKTMAENLESINEMNRNISSPPAASSSITNQGWLKRMAEKQERTGVKVLTEEEMKRIKRDPKYVAAIKIESSGEISVSKTEDSLE